MSFEVSPLQREAARLVTEMDRDRGRTTSGRIRAIANAKPRADRSSTGRAAERDGGAQPKG